MYDRGNLDLYARNQKTVAPQLESYRPITVHRPSTVVGDARPGKVMHFQVFYHRCEFLPGQPTLRYYDQARAASAGRAAVPTEV